MERWRLQRATLLLHAAGTVKDGGSTRALTFSNSRCGDVRIDVLAVWFGPADDPWQGEHSCRYGFFIAESQCSSALPSFIRHMSNQVVV